MGIKVKHAPSAAAIGESAYTIGRGEKMRWSKDIALKEQALDLQAASIRARTAAIKQREKESQRLHGLREDELGFRKEQWQDEPARQLERGLQQQKLLQSKVSWQYDEGQKREMAKVTTGVAWLRDQVSAGKWTAEQAEQAEQQLWRKYHSIIPLPVYDDKATPQEIYNSTVVKDPITGFQYRMNERGGFDDVGIPFKDYANLRADVAKAFTSQITDPESKDFGKETTDWDAVDKFVDDTMVRFTKIQGFAARAEEEKAIQQQKLQRAAAEAQQEEQQEEMRAKIEALPVMFDTIIKGQPKIGRKKKGVTSGDKVYGEEAYNKILIEAVERAMREGVSPKEVKNELDKWWDAEYDKERGQMFQKFGDRRQFEAAQLPAATQKGEPTKRQKAIDYVKGVLQQGEHALLTDKARRDVGVKMLAEAGFKVTADELKTKPIEKHKPAPAKRKVAPEVDMTKLDEMAKNRIQQFKGMKDIKWSWVSEKFGPETAAELKYICESGNEQAIANALQRLGII